MRYPVPQFQDVEDKIIASLTFKQFVYVVGGAGLSYVILINVFFPFNLLLVVPVAGLSFALAFYKINNQPFINILEAWFFYLFKKKLYLWKHIKVKEKKSQSIPVKKDLKEKEHIEQVRMSNNMMKELSWQLDINENMHNAEEFINNK